MRKNSRSRNTTPTYLLVLDLAATPFGITTLSSSPPHVDDVFPPFMFDSSTPLGELLRTSTSLWVPYYIYTLLPFSVSVCCLSHCCAVPFIYTPPRAKTILPVEIISSMVLFKIMSFLIVSTPPHPWAMTTIPMENLRPSYMFDEPESPPSLFALSAGQWPPSGVCFGGVGNDATPWRWLPLFLADGFGGDCFRSYHIVFGVYPSPHPSKVLVPPCIMVLT